MTRDAPRAPPSHDAGASPANASDAPYRAPAPLEAFGEFAPTPRDPPWLQRAVLAVLAGLAVAVVGAVCAPALGVAFFSGALIGLFGGVLMYVAKAASRGGGARTARARASRICDAEPGLVEIQGRVRPGEGGALIAPASGVEAVWARIIASAVLGEDSSVVLDETASRDFLVDDDSGEVALVQPREAVASFGYRLEPASAIVGLRRVRFEEFPPRLVDYLRSRGRCQEPGEDDDLVVDEIVIEPWDTLVVVGPARRASGADGKPRLVLSAGDASGQALLLMRRSPRERHVSRLFAGGAVLAGLGLVLVLLSVLVHTAK